MDNEVREAYQEAFDQIISVLTLMGLSGGVIALLGAGPGSPWFLRAVALLAVVVVAFVLRRAGQFVVAANVLVLELIGLVAGALLQAGTLTGFIPYLLIPTIVIASIILSPAATMVMAVFAIGVTLIMAVVMGQFTLANLLVLLPPFGLLVLTALLSTFGAKYVTKIDNRLLDSKNLLRNRTLELLKVLEEAQELQIQIKSLTEQLLRARTAPGHTRQGATTQRDYQLSGLMGGAIEELKTSVKKLEQATEALAERTNGQAQPNLLPQVWQQIDHLNGLLIGLEQMVALENNEFQLDYQTIDLTQLLSEVVQIARGLARDKNLDVRFIAPESLPPLQADPTRLRQVLLHLLSNAVKYTDQGLIEVQTERIGSELTIFISDTGSGMSDEALSANFQTFVPGERVSTRQNSDAGLGLPLSKRIIELHGGRLWATSVIGVGSTFCMSLPLEADPAKTPLPLPALTPTAVIEPGPAPQLAAAVPAAGQSKATPPVSTSMPKPSRQLPAKPAPSPLPVNFGPVARFSPLYISRFGIMLLILLVLITSVALALAVTNGLNRHVAQTTQATPAASPLKATNSVAAPETPPIATVTPPPTATHSPLPTSAPVKPISTVATLSVTQPLSQTKPAPELLPSPPATVRPTRTPVATPTPRPTALPTASPSPTLPAVPTQPENEAKSPAKTPAPAGLTVTEAAFTPTTLPLPAFVVDLQHYPVLIHLGFESAPNTDLTIATNPAANGSLSWQRTESGYQAVFSRDLTSGNRDLYLAQRDGDRPLNLTQAAGDDLQPAISPDTRRIAFSSGRGGNLDIYVMDSTGGNLTQLTSSRGFDEWPAWSPDGRQIAFVSDRDGNVEIYTMNSDGSNPQRLTNHPADDWPVIWSPGGNNLLFASNRDGNWNLYLLEIQGGNLTRLTNDPGDERDPAWSPDGQTIAFAYNNGGQWDIFSLPAPTFAPVEIPRSQWAQVTATSKDERYPTWLPLR